MPRDNVSPTLELAIRNFAESAKKASVPERYVTQVDSITDRKTTGSIIAGVGTVRMRNSVGIAVGDWIIVEVDPRAQDQWVFVSFAKKPAGTAPAVPDVYTTAVESPPSEDLTVAASAGQTTTIGASGDPVVIAGDPDKTWPFDLSFLLFDSSDSKCVEYSTIALAIAAAATGDTIFVPPGTHTCDAQTLPDGVNLVGLDRDNTILTSSAQSTTLTVGLSCYVDTLTVTNTRADSTTYAIYMVSDLGIELVNVKATTSNSNGAGSSTYGLYASNCGVGISVKLRNCVITGSMTAGGTGYGVGVVNSGTLEIFGGYISGTTYDISTDNPTVNVFGPVLENNTVQVSGSGSINGIWYDSAGDFGAYSQGQISINGTDRLQVDDEGISSLDRPFTTGAFYDYQLNDATDGDHFRQNTGTYPAGWTESDAAVAVSTAVLYSFWYFRDNNTDRSWKYRKQLSRTIGGITASRWFVAMFGPLMWRQGNSTQDIHYYLGLYSDNGGGVIDEDIYIRAHIWWDSANTLWKVRAEEGDGSAGGEFTAPDHTSSWMTFSWPVTFPIYLRVQVQNDASQNCRAYLGTVPEGRTLELLLSQNPTVTNWDTSNAPWVEFHHTRTVGDFIEDYLYLGAIDWKDESF